MDKTDARRLHTWLCDRRDLSPEMKPLLPIIDAYAEGKAIEYCCHGDWSELKNPDFNYPASDYRVFKPKPNPPPLLNLTGLPLNAWMMARNDWSSPPPGRWAITALYNDGLRSNTKFYALAELKGYLWTTDGLTWNTFDAYTG